MGTFFLCQASKRREAWRSRGETICKGINGEHHTTIHTRGICIEGMVPSYHDGRRGTRRMRPMSSQPVQRKDSTAHYCHYYMP